MAIPTTPAYDAAIARPEQAPIVRVLADWDRDGFALSGNRYVDDPQGRGWVAADRYAMPLIFRSQPLSLLWPDDPRPGGMAYVNMPPLAAGKTYRCSVVLTTEAGPPVRFGDLHGPNWTESATVDTDETLTVHVTATTSTRIGLFTASASTPSHLTFHSVSITCDDRIDDLTPLVREVSVTQAITTDLPDITRLVAGESVASATVRLGGDPTDSQRDGLTLWSPYSTDTPLGSRRRRGLPVRIDLGYRTMNGAETLPVLAGRTRDTEVDAATGEAVMEVLDGSGAGTKHVELPIMVGNETQGLFQQRPGLNSQAFIDLLARALGYFASPPQRPGCVLSVPMHGTLYAEQQTATAGLNLANHLRLVDDATDDVGVPVPFRPGRFALAPTPVPPNLYTAVYVPATPLSQRAGSTWLHECWIHVPDRHNPTPLPDAILLLGDPSGAWAAQITLNVNPAGLGQVTMLLTRGGVQRTLDPATGRDLAPGWHYLAVYAAFPSSTEIQTVWRVDQAESGFGVAGLPTAATALPMTVYAIQSFTPIEAVQLTLERFEPVGDPNVTWNDTFAPTAVLEPGLAELTATPTARTDDARQTLQDIVAAEYGVLLHRTVGDQPDVLTFWNRQHWRTNPEANQPVRTLTAARHITALTVAEPEDAVRNVIRVPVQPLHIHPTGLVWDIGPDRVERVPARGQLVIWASFGDFLAYRIDTTGSVIPAGGATVNNRSGYRAARRPNGTGGQITNLSMRVEPFAASCKITFQNPNRFDAYLVSPAGAGFPPASDGKGSVALIGRKVSRTPPALDTGIVDPGATADFTVETRSEASITAHDGVEHVLAVPESPWRQNGTDAGRLGLDLRRALAFPAPQVTSLDIVADPSVQPGDLVQVQDRRGTRLDDAFWVVGNRITYTDTFATQSVTLRGRSRPHQMLLGVAGRDELGINPV